MHLVLAMLQRLTTNQRRCFLKDLGLEGIPEKRALREYERRLGLKGLDRELTAEERAILERYKATLDYLSVLEGLERMRPPGSKTWGKIREQSGRSTAVLAMRSLGSKRTVLARLR